MNFKKLKLIGANPINLPIANAAFSDRYLFKGADGLGPPEVDVHIFNNANEGAFYQGRRSYNRELIVRIGLNPAHSVGETFEDLRTELYGLLSPGLTDDIQVELMNADDVVVAKTSGYVKKIEQVLFSKTPEAQITIPCTSPYFEAPDVVSLPTTMYNPLQFEYEGNAPTGMRMQLTFLSDWSFIFFADQIENWEKIFIVGDPISYIFKEGDILTIDTNPGSRSIVVTRDGVEYNFISGLLKGSSWISLHAGINTFYIFHPSLFEWNYIEYTPKYWGV